MDRISAEHTHTPSIFKFEKIFSEYRDGFVDIAYSYVHDQNAAEDIVTDSFVYLWEHREEIRWEINIKGYIYIAVRSRCISWLRGQQSLLKAKGEMSRAAKWRIESGLNSLSNDELSRQIYSSDIMKIFRQTLERMPEQTRKVFLASRSEGLTYSEIAEKYNISPRKVTAEIQSALRIMKHSLKDYLVLIPFLMLLISSR